MENLRHLENTLKDVAYPDLNKELSEEDKLDLFNLFGQTTDPDWKNSDVVSYSK